VGIGYAAFHSLITKSTSNVVNIKAVQPPKVQKPAIPMIPTRLKQGITFTGHQQIVRSVAWSPDGMTLASGADDAQLLLWGTDGAVRQRVAHPASIHALAWSPDSQKLVTGSNNQVLFLNVQTGAPLFRSTHRHRAAVSSLAWTAHNQDLQVVSGGVDNRAIVWNTTKYGSQTIFMRHTAPIESVSWAMDGQTVASSSQGGVVRVWNAMSGQEVHPFYLDANNVAMRVLAFSPVNTTLAVGGDDGVVRFWNAPTCQQQTLVNGAQQCVDVPQRIQVSRSAIRSLAWSPDGKFLAIGSSDGVLSIWQATQYQKPLLTMTIQQNTPVHSITWAPKSDQIAVSAGNQVTLWSLI
jgi:WD40 repeat protein